MIKSIVRIYLKLFWSRVMKSIVLKMLLFIILLYTGATYMLYSTQDEKVFVRKHLSECNVSKAKPISFQTNDGLTLEGAYLEQSKDAPLVLYFGGNAENVLCFIENIASKIKGYNFVAFNYPGYGKSEGKPSQEKILKYTLELYKKYQPSIVAGRSLGSTVATYVASKEPVQKLLLITPIDSIVNIAKSKFPYLPIGLLLKHPFEADKWMQNVQAKVAVVLVEDENIVPQKNQEQLLKAIKNLTFKKVIKGVNHNNLYNFPQTIQTLQEALDSLKK